MVKTKSISSYRWWWDYIFSMKDSQQIQRKGIKNEKEMKSKTNKCIFDSNYEYALPLSKENLDKYCKSDIGEVCYKYCKLAYRIADTG